MVKMLRAGSKARKVDRKIIRKSVKKLVRDIERRTKTPVPELTRKFIFDTAMREISGVNISEMPRFLSQKISKLNKSMKIFDEMSKGADENCKLMIEKLVRKLYEARKEPFLTFWQHMSVINYCVRVSEDLENEHFRSMKKDTQIFLISYLYVAIYELAVESLFDVALEISKKNPDDETNLKLKRAHERKPYLRAALFEFLEKEGYLDHKGSEFLRELSNFRDKIAHLLVYFDSEQDKLFLDGEYVDSSVVREMYEKLLSLFSCLISTFFKESGLMSGLNDLEAKLRIY